MDRGSIDKPATKQAVQDILEGGERPSKGEWKSMDTSFAHKTIRSA